MFAIFFIFIRLAKNDLHIILASRIHASNQANKVSITLDEQEPSFFNTKSVYVRRQFSGKHADIKDDASYQCIFMPSYI